MNTTFTPAKLNQAKLGLALASWRHTAISSPMLTSPYVQYASFRFSKRITVCHSSVEVVNQIESKNIKGGIMKEHMGQEFT
jgi:hypothetical protein